MTGNGKWSHKPGIVLALLILAAAALSCDKEERDFHSDPSSASTIQAARVGPPLVGMLPATMPATAPSPRPVRHNFESNAYALSEGKRLYEAFNCVGCHAHGGGGMGPALMDNEWIHGSEPEVIFGGIVDGWPDGMPAFRGKIADYQVWQIVAYVRSLGGISSSKDAAPGRDDHMHAAWPPNSTSQGRPRTSTVPLQELRKHQDAEFARMGGLNGVISQFTTQRATTLPASTQSNRANHQP